MMSRPLAARSLATRSLVTIVAAGVAVVVLAATAPAQTFAPIYGIRHTAPPEIWSIDLQTGQATFVSSNLKKTKVACARHPRTGLVWTFSNVTPNKISTWDPVADVETTVHNGPSVQFHRVGFTADAKLYGVPLNSNVLFEIDTTTGNLTNLGGLQNVDPAGDGGDLCFAPGETIRGSYFAGTKYYDIDVGTQNSTLINSAVGFKVTGAAYTADGRLWVTSDTDLYECDPADGTMTLVGGFGMKQILDITEDLSPMYFGVDPLDVAPNQSIDLYTRQGAAGGPMLLCVIDVNGAPLFLILGVFAFDGAGEWALNDTVPPGLSGTTATLESIGFAQSGALLITNAKTITFL